jgi:hypothetical protein
MLLYSQSHAPTDLPDYRPAWEPPVIADGAPAAPGAVLSSYGGGALDPGPHLRGFGGLHGGLVLSLMVSAMAQRIPDPSLRSVTGRYYRPVSGEFGIETEVVRNGRSSATVSAWASGERGVHVEATGVFGPAGTSRWPAIAPRPPAAPPPQDCDEFAIPPEFVPIAAHMQIRPVGPNRPYAGGDDPELTAWIRLTEDDLPPGLLRFILLMDGLAPAYAAVLSDLVLIPTVEFTVRPAAALAKAASPWVLLRARTVAAGSDGWNEEQVQAWDLDGGYLGSAQQLRMTRAG